MTYLVEIDDIAYIIDPGDMSDVIDAVRRDNLVLKGVLLTHAHYDHIYGLNKLIEAFHETKVYTNDIGKQMLINERLNLSLYNDTPFVFEYPENIVVIDGATEVGPFKVYETPGHNPSCLTFVSDDAVFTGDAYIPGVAVVTNLPKGNKEQARQSVAKILDLAKGKTIYPGHHISAN
jgi:glyoxylase-like metal-dependent hydrolase (beta-lactamase superfamily II)